MGCLASAKLNMLLDILKVSSSPEATGGGSWQYIQDPTTGAIERKWVADDGTATPQTGIIKDVPCLARGILTAGIRGAADTQSFSAVYQNVEWIRVYVSADTNISKKDRVTRIRDRAGNVAWKEEESDGTPPTIFNVMGITPIPGPFGQIVELQVLLKRAETQ